MDSKQHAERFLELRKTKTKSFDKLCLEKLEAKNTKLKADLKAAKDEIKLIHGRIDRVLAGSMMKQKTVMISLVKKSLESIKG